MSERLYTFVVSPDPAMLDVMDGENVHDRIAFLHELSNEPPSLAFLNAVKGYCSDHDPPLIITSVSPLSIQARPARNEVERVRARYSGDRLVSTEDFKQLIEDADTADRAAELSAEADDVERDEEREPYIGAWIGRSPQSDVEREAEAAESSDLRRESWISARVGQLERKRMSRSAALRQARDEADTMTFPSRFERPYTTGVSSLSEPPTWHETREEAEAWIGEQGPGSYYLNGPSESDDAVAVADETMREHYEPERSALDVLRAAADEEFDGAAAPSQGVAATTAIHPEGEPDEREHEILTLAFRHCQARDDLPRVVAIERVMAIAMIAVEYVSEAAGDDGCDPAKLRAAEARLMRQIEPFLPNAEFDA